ncbi:MAG: 1,4-dihydroxy-2-naphthoate polyprenyltransferase [Polyangiaceae bacterium]|nr:1,4-dihydroxy-2-naphthoate polyprenyltransferase [Polyangiaceae bacterium]
MTSTVLLPDSGSMGAWLLAARPQTLPVAVAPVAVGTAVASTLGPVRWGAVAAALIGALAIQIGTNFANDVFDHEKGADTAERLGPTRAVQSGLLSAPAVKIGMIVAFVAAFLAGVYLTTVAGAPIVVIGVASILSGIAYTGGPYPLGYHGLGDLFVLAFFGFVAVAGTSLVAAGSVPPLAWLAAVPVGALATAVLVVNNARDHQTDVRAGKRTLVVRFGRRFANLEYGTLVAAAYLAPAVMALTGLARPGVLAPWLTLPWAVWLCVRVTRAEGRALNPLLPATARLLLGVSALLAIGIAFR